MESEDMHIDSHILTEMEANMRRIGLGQSIKDAFQDSSAVLLRRWYVDTFVLDPTNQAILRDQLKGNLMLERQYETMAWVSIEHAAIGTRLLYAMRPEMIAPNPELLEPDAWRTEDALANHILRIVEPWNTIRYDPEGENWYQAIGAGQWHRLGKGAPSQNVVDEWISKWLIRIDPVKNPDAYSRWPIDTAKYAGDEVDARWGAVQSSWRKIRNVSTTKARIRQALERKSIMYIDTSTINQVRNLTPFSNGALALVKHTYTDTTGVKHTIKPGQLLPLDIEYMVMNANPLKWDDPQGRIPEAADDLRALEGDFWKAIELQDELLYTHCQTYWSFLTHAFPDPTERSAFLRLLGCAMYGTNIKIVAAMIGEPNAGKDTAMNWLSYLMPGQVAHLPFSAFTPYGDDDRGFAPLRGARVATVSGEVGEGRGSKLLAEKIKTVASGGGGLRVAEKYEKPTTIWFDGMLLLQGNSVPMIAGGDRALYTNRLVAVPFNHPFPLNARSFEDEYRAEAPYFAQVIFINYLQYQYDGGGMNGIDPPPSWRDFAKEFADSSNPHGFLEACIVKSSKPVSTQQFHQALSAMVNRFGSPYPVGTNYWPKRLRTIGFDTKDKAVKAQVMKNGERQYMYYLTVDAEKSDGAFTQAAWDNIMKDAAVTS